MATTYFKIFRHDHCHHGFQFQKGLNVIKQDFQKKMGCEGGFHFCGAKHILEYVTLGDVVRKIEIAPGAHIFHKAGDARFKADAIILKSAYELSDPETFAMLRHYGADITQADVVIWACQKGYLPVLSYLASVGADLQAGNNEPFKAAAAANQLHVVTYLWSKAEPKIKAADMTSALIRTASRGHREMVIWLWLRGADVVTQDSIALRLAVVANNVALVEFLIQAGCDVQAVQNQCLKWAAKASDTDTIRCLVKYGADTSCLTDEIFLDLVRENRVQMVKFLSQITHRMNHVLRKARLLAHNNPDMTFALAAYDKVNVEL